MTPDNELIQLLKQRTPERYAKAAVLWQEVGTQIIERLGWITLQPQVIVEVGAGVGGITAQLLQHYKNARLIAIHSAEEFLQPITLPIEMHCAPLEALPLADLSVDLLIANLALPWCVDFACVLQEWRRVLRPEGMVMFTALGPDTLRELHHTSAVFPHLMDMHHIGDLLTKLRFADPVLDVDYLTFSYADPALLWQELYETSMVNHAADLPPAKHYPVTYEVIFAHAFRPPLMTEQVADEEGTVQIPLSHLRKKTL